MSSNFLILLAVAAVAAVGAVASAVVLGLQRRHTRQLRRIVQRLDRLDQAGVLTRAETAAPRPSSPSEEDAEAEQEVPSGDVLAGMTSRVRRMVEHREVSPVTLVDEAIVCVYEHLDEAFSPSQLAEELFVSLRSLERGLVAGMQCTPRQLIRAVKMREARRMMVSGRYNVAEVAGRTGYSSPFHFSRSFKDFFGVAPSRVRSDARPPSRAQER